MVIMMMIMMILSSLVSEHEVLGPVLRLYKVSRMDMGAYMCIARNGVPPAVSKRIELGIDCKYSMVAPSSGKIGPQDGATIHLFAHYMAPLHSGARSPSSGPRIVI